MALPAPVHDLVLRAVNKAVTAVAAAAEAEGESRLVMKTNADELRVTSVLDLPAPRWTLPHIT